MRKRTDSTCGIRIDGNDLIGWSSDYKREHFYSGCPNELHKDDTLCAPFIPTSWAVRATVEQFPNFLFPAIEQFPTTKILLACREKFHKIFV